MQERICEHVHSQKQALRLTLNTHNKVTAHTEELFEIQFQSLKLLFETPLKRDYFTIFLNFSFQYYTHSIICVVLKFNATYRLIEFAPH